MVSLTKLCRITMIPILLLLVVTVVRAKDIAPQNLNTNETVCASGATLCKDTYSNTGFGCCVLPNAVCCPGNFCCPSGSQCSGNTCTQTKPEYPCGPVQGQNCSQSFVCAPGPLPWTPTPGIRNVMVIGDSVSIGWTPVLKNLLANASSGQQSYVTHSPASGDGGARSTSDMLQCYDYRVSTSTLKSLPMTDEDLILFNFGLHDYNMGLAGGKEYGQELTTIVSKLKTVGPKLMFVLTTPCHNCDNPEDAPTVVELNKIATSIMQNSSIPIIDVYTPIMEQCGPVPWADSGPSACNLCAPDCKKLSVHYTTNGYEFIAGIVSNHTALYRR